MFVSLLFACSEYGVGGVQKAPVPEAEPEPEEDDDAPPAEGDEPIADAGPNAESSPLETITLDGTESYDPNGLEIIAMEWTIVSVPSGSTAELSDREAARPTLFLDLAGTYELELTVQNEDGVWDSTPDKVKIESVPLDGFYVELSWDVASDLDLHLMRSGSALFSEGDCSFCNANPSWFLAGRADDPSLDADAIDGFGPETITIDEPAEDTYSVSVHYYGETGLPDCVGPCLESVGTVRIYIGGLLAAEFEQTLTGDGDHWRVAEIEWPSGEVTELGELDFTNKIECTL